VPKEYNVAAILSLRARITGFCVGSSVLLHQHFSKYVYSAQYSSFFYSPLTSWFPGMVLTYFLNDFEMVPVTPIITDITLVFTFHIRCISTVRSLHFKIFSASI
jgi:hypothetical protein